MTFKRVSLLQLFLSVNIFLCSVDHTSSIYISYHKKGNWCYQDASCKQGAPGSEWETGVCASGKKQTPIDLNPLLIPSSETLDFSATKDKYAIKGFKIKNEHNSVQIIPTTPEASFNWKDTSGVNREYKLLQAHFHWGPQDDLGSEHTIDGRSFSMELHMVHYNGKFADVTAAMASEEKDAFAVIGVMLQADPSVTAASLIGPISAALSNIASNDQEFEMAAETLHLESFISLPSAEAFTYFGSLTTPACNEIVNWIVLRKPYFIMPSEVAAFRTIIKDSQDKLLLLSYRKLQMSIDRGVSALKLT